MSTNVSLGITLTLLGAATATGALGTVAQRVDSINRKVVELKEKRSSLGAMTRDWTLGGEAVKKYGSAVEKLDRNIEALTAKASRLQMLGAKMNAAREDMRNRLGDIASVYGMTRMLGAPVGAFVRQDDAANALKVAMMDERGDAGEHFEAVRRRTTPGASWC